MAPRITSLLFCAVLTSPLPAVGQPGPDQPEPEEWVVAVQFGQRLLSDDLVILRRDERFHVPLADLAAVLLVPVEIRDDGTVEGTVSSTGREFRLDPEAGRVVIDGDRDKLAPGELIEGPDGAYVSRTLAERILGISLALDERTVALQVTADQPLPIEVLERQEHLRQALLQPEQEPAEAVPREVPYALGSLPMGDVDLFARRDPDGGMRLQYDTVMSAELAYLTTFLFARGDEQEPLRDARLLAGRASFDGGAFGVDPLTEAWAGDVQRPFLPLVGGGKLGPAILVSSFPLDRPDDFSTTSIDGDAQPGWDVELYQNGLLIDFQQVGPDGRYRFEDVPLLYGINRFRLVLYGPQGQIREETRQVAVGELAKPGETLFRGYAGLPAQRSLAPILPGDGTYDDAGFSIEVEHGFNRHLSGTAFVSRGPTSKEHFSDFAYYGGLGARLSWRNFAVNTTAALQDDGGHALEIGAIADFGGIFLSGRHARFSDFRSTAASVGFEPLESVTALRAQTWFSDTPLGSFNLSARAEHRSFVEDRDAYVAGADVRHNIGPLHLDHALDLQYDVFGDGAFEDASIIYSPTLSAQLGDVWGRAGARIDLTSSEPFQSLVATARHRISDTSLFGGSVAYSPISDSLSVSADYSRELSFGVVSASVGMTEGREVSVGIGLTFSFGFDSERRPFVTSERLAESGAIAPFVYHDRDADGHYDRGSDAPLADVGFVLSNAARPEQNTDETGTATITNLSTARATVIDVDAATLKDPFWIPAPGPIRLQARAGRILPVEIPVVEGGEISGHVSARMASRLQPVAGVEVQLLDAEGRYVAGRRTQSDGFYLFETVPPGEYLVQIEPGQSLGENPLPPTGSAVSLAAGGEIVDGLDLTIETTGWLPRPQSREDLVQ